MVKVSIIGAGNVGATTALRILEKDLANIVMIDVRSDLAKAKSFDMTDAAYLNRHERHIFGGSDYQLIENSAIVVVTAGFPRNPGMSREELLTKNRGIIEEVSTNIKTYSPRAIVIIVTNPLDVMTYIAYRACATSKNRVFGMAGDLDASRFAALIADRLNVDRSSINTIVMGSHGDTMVPILSQTRVNEKNIKELLSADEVDKLVEATKKRGAEIVSLFGQGSAYYAPSAAVANLVESILLNKKRIHCVSAFLEGEYGLNDICVGVPVKINRNGIEEIIEIDLSEDERRSFLNSANVIKNNLESIK